MPFFNFLKVWEHSYHWNQSYTSSSVWYPFGAKSSISAEKTPKRLGGGGGRAGKIPPSLAWGKKKTDQWNRSSSFILQMFQFGLLTVHYTNLSISFLAEGLTKHKDDLSLGEKIQEQIFLKLPSRWRNEPWHCTPHKQHSTPLSQSPSFQGRIGKCYVARGISVLEMKSLVSQNCQPEASGLSKPRPLSEQAPSMLLRLAHISPILGLAKAGKDFRFFFSPQQKAHTAKASFDNCHFWAFLLKTKLSIYFTYYFFRRNSWESRPS